MRMKPHRDGMLRCGSGGGLIGLIKVVVPLFFCRVRLGSLDRRAAKVTKGSR